MESFFSLTVTIEPDRQRFARFAAEAVHDLGGNPFAAGPSLVAFLGLLREHTSRGAGGMKALLCLEGERLFGVCNGRRLLLATLPGEPSSETVLGVAEHLRNASENADPELLVRRNRLISSELEQARERAAAEMAQLEAMLEKKKRELQDSIRQAETDGLTGLLNRGAYDQHLQDAVTRNARQRYPLSLVLLDLDKFKEINDAHGHQYGDEYLRRAARSMREASRDQVDEVCRIGGDEFAIIVHAGVDTAARIAERVLELMDHRISIGVAQLRADDTLKTLVARADEALYEAKGRGRGQMALAEGTGVEGWQGAAR